jgi:hypothetical protein
LSVVRQGERVTLTVELMRDGPEEVEVASRVKVVDVGEDANGRTMSSLIVEPAEENPAGPGSVGKRWPPSLKVFHGALVEAILGHGVRHQIEGGPLVQAVDVEKARQVFYETYVVASKDDSMGATAEQLQDTKRKAFARNLERAQSYHLIGARAVGEAQLIWPATFADRG